MKNEIDIILDEDLRREAEQRAREEAYDPITGVGSLIPRKATPRPPFVDEPADTLLLPLTMLADPAWPRIKNHHDYTRLRFRHDFEYWAYKCVMIRDKESGHRIPFRLNAPQRRFLAMLEEDRRAERPIRIVMLKARQWGGSTLVQMYFAYLQIIQLRNWHSIICSHVRDTSATIRAMYAAMLRDYPEQYWDEDDAPRLKTVSGSSSKQEIVGRGSTIDISSACAPDALRGNDFALAHLSEVAFWPDSPRRSIVDAIRTVAGSVPLLPNTAIILESSADGIGNYFHTLWLDSSKGQTAFQTIFVPWLEIARYRLDLSADPDRRRALAESLTEYEKALVAQGATLGQIAWRRKKRGEYPSDEAMAAEFPATDIEAFVNTGSGVFNPADCERLRLDCRTPEFTGRLSGAALTGPLAMKSISLIPDPNGALEIWQQPDPSALPGRYVVTVDIGGRSAKSDWSVIAVMDRGEGPDAIPEVVAQWRGHADHDIVCWQAAAIATYYHTALLVIESNSLESGGVAAADDASFYILGQLRDAYPRLYFREKKETTARGYESRPGFHTGRHTKVAALSALIAALRDSGYVERSELAVNEMLTYQLTPDGRYEARRGYHDDILMTRAISLYVISQTPSPRHIPIPLPSLPVW